VPPAGEFALAGIIVSEPPVGLVLPVPPAGGLAADGVTVSEPMVGLVLPVPPAIGLAGAGVVVAEPEVFLRLEVAPGGGGGSEGPLGEGGKGGENDPAATGLQLRVVELAEPTGSIRPASQAAAAWHIVLEWQGPPAGRYVIESSVDLLAWVAEEAEVLLAEDGRFRARCVAPQPGAGYYRVRQLP
jgi:hypothetical protein